MTQPLSIEQLNMLCNTAIKAAQEAGQWIEQVDRQNLQHTFKDVGSTAASQLVTAVDIRSEEIIRQHLQAISETLDIAFVGEESSLNVSNAAHERFEKPYFWCVDPLDGTLPFVEGRSGYAVSIAFVEQSGNPLIGVVYDPSNQTTYHAIQGQGGYQNLTPFKPVKRSTESITVYADTSFKTHAHYKSATTVLQKCAQALNINDVTFVYGNGAVKNACYVLHSSQSCYLKLPKKEEGGGSIWDYAATSCIVREAGGWVSDIYGQPLELNRQDSSFMNHKGVVFASDDEIAESLINGLGEVFSGGI